MRPNQITKQVRRGLGRQRQRSARKKRRPKREIWASRSIYRLLLWLFRPRPGNDPLRPPFCINRPLSKNEFLAAQEQYVSARTRRRTRLGAAVTSRRDIGAVFPFFDQAERVGDWEAHKLIGKAMFASKPERSRLRAEAISKKVFISGPVARRKFLAEAWRALPQAKNTLSGLDAMRIAAYRRGREFVWAFLTGEARALAKCRGAPVTANVPSQGSALAQHYSWLGLTAGEIRAALATGDVGKQADLDAAATFNLSPSYVRRIL